MGLSGQEAARTVALGDFVTLERPFVRFGNGRLCSKAFDNRVGCFCLLEALKRVEKPLLSVHAVFSVQEEVGLRGAGTAAFGLEADAALAIDTTGAADIPLCRPQDYLVRLGGGVAVSAIDAATITPKWLFDDLTDLCRKENIRHQVRIAPRGGGTTRGPFTAPARALLPARCPFPRATFIPMWKSRTKKISRRRRICCAPCWKKD